MRNEEFTKASAAKHKSSSTRMLVPFDVVCQNCHLFIGMGSKVNTRTKRLPEKYFSFPIVQFTFSCPRCTEPIEFKSDPKNRTYAMVSGGELTVPPATERAQSDLELLNEVREKMTARDVKCEIFRVPLYEKPRFLQPLP